MVSGEIASAVDNSFAELLARAPGRRGGEAKRCRLNVPSTSDGNELKSAAGAATVRACHFENDEALIEYLVREDQQRANRRHLPDHMAKACASDQRNETAKPSARIVRSDPTSGMSQRSKAENKDSQWDAKFYVPKLKGMQKCCQIS